MLGSNPPAYPTGGTQAAPPPNTAGAAAARPLRHTNTPCSSQGKRSKKQGQLLRQLCTGTIPCQVRLELRPEGPAPPAVIAHGGGLLHPGPPLSHRHVPVQ